MSKMYIKSVILMHVSCCDPLPNMVLAGRGDAVRTEVWRRGWMCAKLRTAIQELQCF